MRNLNVFITILIVLSFTGCAKANISRSREAYILSQPHGWIEITISDIDIPSELPPKDMKPEDKAKWEPKPPICYFIVKLNNERFLQESIFPFGSVAPYEVDTGFRIPAPVGEFELVIQYVDCDIKDEEMASVSFSAVVTIDENMVTSIFFYGDSIEILGQKENDEVTLKDIYKKLDELKR